MAMLVVFIVILLVHYSNSQSSSTTTAPTRKPTKTPTIQPSYKIGSPTPLPTSSPSLPPTQTFLLINYYWNSDTCSGNPNIVEGVVQNLCFPYYSCVLSDNYQCSSSIYSCNNNIPSAKDYANITTCNGVYTTDTYLNTCQK